LQNLSHEEHYHNIKLAGQALEQVKHYEYLGSARVGLMKKVTTQLQQQEDFIIC
jgi:hypothetical protein